MSLVDEMLCRWAEQKCDIDRVVAVEFEYAEGWLGTDVTPGYEAEFTVWVTGADGKSRSIANLSETPALIREILTFALKAREHRS